MNKKTKELEQLAEPLKRWLELHFHVHTNIIIGFDSVKVVCQEISVPFKNAILLDDKDVSYQEH